MDHLKTWMTLAALIAALGACSKPADKAAEAAEAAEAADAGKTASASAPVSMTMPKRKAGLWEQSMEMAGMAGAAPGLHQVSSICVDPASEGEMSAMGMQMSKDMKCSEQHVSRTLSGGVEFSSVCPMGDSGTVASKGVMTGDFNAAYKMEMTSTTTGAAAEQMNGEHKMTLTATWKGPCPPDMKPGDIRLSGVPGMPAGATFNAAEMAKAGHAPSPEQIAAMRKQAEAMQKQMQK